jgi:uncharacterized protein (TIGR03435 family)
MYKIAALTVLLAIQVDLSAQTAPSRPQFDVVSIKPNDAPERHRAMLFMPRGGLRCIDYTLKDLIRLGWDVRDFQIRSGPKWLDTDRYNIEANPADPLRPTADDRQRLGLMVQSLLADRFGLKVHRETREERVYFLTVAKNGTTLRRMGDDLDQQTSMHDSKGHLFATKINMPILGRNLAGIVGVPVIDRTDLMGVYDIQLEWNADDNAQAPDATSAPSLFTAVQEQLGLKLESGRGPVEILVVDAAEKASAN